MPSIDIINKRLQDFLSIKAIEKEREGLINIGFIVKKYRAKRGEGR